MAVAQAQGSTEALEALVGQHAVIVRTSLPVAARLHTGGPTPVLLLDPDAPREDRTVALLEALGRILVGPAAVTSGRRVQQHRHLRVVP
jgi:hypothetical protein